MQLAEMAYPPSEQIICAVGCPVELFVGLLELKGHPGARWSVYNTRAQRSGMATPR
jgi:hypothetical protein